MTYLLDTHAWIWLISSPGKLSTKIRTVIQSADDPPDLLLSAVSLVELATLVEKGRIETSLGLEPSVNLGISTLRLRVVPLTMEIALETGHLPDFNHFDPADRIIVATARLEKAVLINR